MGSACLPVLRKHEHLKLIVQDTGDVSNNGPVVCWTSTHIRSAFPDHLLQYWQNHYPEALTAGRVSFQAHNFFDPQPIFSDGHYSAPGAMLMRAVMHDWSDENCGTILRNARAIAGSETKLVIIDLVFSRACEDKEMMRMGAFQEVPKPLLANWGAARGLGYEIDLAVSYNYFYTILISRILLTLSLFS